MSVKYTIPWVSTTCMGHEYRYSQVQVWVEILLPTSFKIKAHFEGYTYLVMGKTCHRYGYG
jgi:hypothetical protein